MSVQYKIQYTSLHLGLHYKPHITNYEYVGRLMTPYVVILLRFSYYSFN